MVPNTILFHDIEDIKFFKKILLCKKILKDFGKINIGLSVYELKDISNMKSLENDSSGSIKFCKPRISK